MARVAGNRWGLEWAHIPEEIRCDNLYEAELDKTGVAIWAVTWQQRIEVTREQTLESFNTLSAAWQLEGAGEQTPAAEDTISATQGGE